MTLKKYASPLTRQTVLYLYSCGLNASSSRSFSRASQGQIYLAWIAHGKRLRPWPSGQLQLQPSVRQVSRTGNERVGGQFWEALFFYFIPLSAYASSIFPEHAVDFELLGQLTGWPIIRHEVEACCTQQCRRSFLFRGVICALDITFGGWVLVCSVSIKKTSTHAMMEN